MWLFCDPVDCSPPSSSVHGISQANILEWVVISFSSGSYQPRNWTHVFCIAGGFFTTEPPGKPICVCVCVCVYIFFSTQMIVSTLRYWKALQTKKIFHSVNHLTLQVADDGGLNLDPLRALILVSDPALVSNGTCGSSTEDSCPATGPNVSTNRAERALQFYFSQGSPGSVICMWP